MDDTSTSTLSLAPSYNPNPTIQCKITFFCVEKTNVFIDIIANIVLSGIFLWLFLEDHQGFQHFLCKRHSTTDFRAIGNGLDYTANVLCGLLLLMVIAVIVFKYKDKKDVKNNIFDRENPLLQKESYKYLTLKFVTLLFINFLADVLGVHLVSEFDSYFQSTQHKRTSATLFSSALFFIVVSGALVLIHAYLGKKSSTKKLVKINIGLAFAFLAQCFGATTLYLFVNNFTTASNTFLLTALGAGFLGAIAATILLCMNYCYSKKQNFVLINNELNRSIETDNKTDITNLTGQHHKSSSLNEQRSTSNDKKLANIVVSNNDNQSLTHTKSASSQNAALIK